MAIVPERECRTPTLTVQSCAIAPLPAAISVIVDRVLKSFLGVVKGSVPYLICRQKPKKCRAYSKGENHCIGIPQLFVAAMRGLFSSTITPSRGTRAPYLGTTGPFKPKRKATTSRGVFTLRLSKNAYFLVNILGNAHFESGECCGAESAEVTYRT
jgi:hypothetical protein